MIKYHFTDYFWTLIFSVVLCVFGSSCFIQNLKPGLDKLERRAIKYVFVGYCHTQKGYHCFDLVHHRFYTSSVVTFFESVSYFAPPGSPSVPQNMITSGYAEKMLYLNHCRCISGVQSQWLLLHS